MPESDLPKLKIETVAGVAHYGWKEDFKTVGEAITYVRQLSKTVDDPETPLERIQVQVEFVGGDFERAGYKSQERVVRFLERCLAEAAD